MIPVMYILVYDYRTTIYLHKDSYVGFYLSSIVRNLEYSKCSLYVNKPSYYTRYSLFKSYDT